MKSESLCVHSVYEREGILQETNFEAFKIIILLLCLHNLSLQDFKEIVALTFCYWEMANQ